MTFGLFSTDHSIGIRQLDNQAEFLNIVDMFKRTFYLYAQKKVDKVKIQAIINKYGLKHVRWALDVLIDQHVGDDGRRQPCSHLVLDEIEIEEKVNGSTTRAYR